MMTGTIAACLYKTVAIGISSRFKK